MGVTGVGAGAYDDVRTERHIPAVLARYLVLGSNGYSSQEKDIAAFCLSTGFGLGFGLLSLCNVMFDVLPEDKIDEQKSHLITLAFLHDNVEGSLLVHRYEDQPPCVRLARHQRDPWRTDEGVRIRGE